MTCVHRKEKQFFLHAISCDFSNCKSKTILRKYCSTLRKHCRCWHTTLLEPIQSSHILIPSLFFSLLIVALINERLESLICTPVLSSPFSWSVWKIHVIWLPLRWFWLGRSASGVLKPGCLAAINHGQARFHAHRSHTSSHSHPVDAQTVLSVRTLVVLLMITPYVSNCWHIVEVQNAFGSQIWRYVNYDVADHKSLSFCGIYCIFKKYIFMFLFVDVSILKALWKAF